MTVTTGLLSPDRSGETYENISIRNRNRKTTVTVPRTRELYPVGSARLPGSLPACDRLLGCRDLLSCLAYSRIHPSRSISQEIIVEHLSSVYYSLFCSWS